MATGVQVTVNQSLFELNPDARVQQRTVGREGHRVVIVDDLYVDFAAVQAFAASQQWTSDPALVHDFPGERCYLPWDTSDLVHAMCAWYGKELPPLHESVPFVASRSFAASWHKPSQRMPHTDDALTALVYLNSADECVGGTGLYRHVGSGFEWIPFMPTKRVLRYAHALGYDINDLRTAQGYAAFVFEVFLNEDFAAPFPDLIGGGNTYWELFDTIEMKPNRLVMYDGRIPHSMLQGRDDFITRPRVYQLCALSRDYANRPSRHA